VRRRLTILLAGVLALHSSAQHRLPDIDISGTPGGVVALPEQVPELFRRHFVKYTKLVAPNGKPIHILAADGWTDDQIRHGRDVLEFLLSDHPGSAHGDDKRDIANAMADRRATMVFFNTEEDLEAAGRELFRGADLSMQDLRANECPAPGDADYMAHATRDAAYEEIWHLIHDYGIKPTRPAMIAEMRAANDAAQRSGWRGWPDDEPQEHPNEYVGVLIDNYYDLWAVHPTLYEARPIEPGDVPAGQSHFGRYFAGSRAAMRAEDPAGYALIREFLPPHLTYTPTLPEDFEGSFSMTFDPQAAYTYKTRHLRNATLAGANDSGLTGNEHDNVLTGNAGDNTLTGAGGNDTLEGGAGRDVASFSGASADYELEHDGETTTVTDSVEGRDGVDVLRGIELLRFQDEQQALAPGDSHAEANDQIRRDKFDLVLPRIMRARGVDMWIHVMREAVPDSLGIDEFGSASGVFVFTDRGGGRIERAVLGRRWGPTQRGWGQSDYERVEDCGAYDIVAEAVRVQEPVGGPLSEYDHRFEGLREFVEQRDPRVIAVNFKHELGPWVTYRGEIDGISHTDYLLLSEELGEPYAERIVSAEYLMMDYVTHRVPSELELLRSMRQAELEHLEEALAAVEPGVTTVEDSGLTVFRRMRSGESQRGRSAAWQGAVVERGDLLAAPSLGYYAYVLRDGETGPPPEIARLWEEYLRVDAILAETIRAGRTPREIMADYTARFAEAGIVVRDNQLHMVLPKNDFAAYAEGFDPSRTHISIDSHAQMKGARPWSDENYFGPRIGSLGPDWSRDIPLPDDHHFVIEYFFYMPSPAADGQDQYLLWWDHEEALATADGIEYLSPPQTELLLID